MASSEGSDLSAPSKVDFEPMKPTDQPQHLQSLSHEPALVSCPSCNELTRTRIERVGSSNPHFWLFDLCCDKLPFFDTSCKDSVHKCGKCDRPLAIAKRSGHTEMVLPVAVRRTVSREELSRPRSARLPNAPNFSRPGTAASRNVPFTNASDSDFQSRFPPPLPNMAVAKEKMPLSIVIKKKQGMDGATDSVVELPHISPKSPESLPRSSAESSNESVPKSTKSGNDRPLSTSTIYHSIPPSPADFPLPQSPTSEPDETDTETIHAR